MLLRACKLSNFRYIARLPAASGLDPPARWGFTLCAWRPWLKGVIETLGKRRILRFYPRHLFEEMAEPWLSLREKYPRIVVAIAAHTIR
jgi:hypothetical protein